MDELYTDDWLERRQLKLSSGEEMQYWFYEPANAGERVVVFLHGIKGHHKGLNGLAWHYRKLFPHDTIVIPDLPGFGQSPQLTKLDEDNLMELYIGALKELLDDIEATEYILIGHSLGATLAYSYLSATQDRRVSEVYLFGAHVTGAAVNGRVLGVYRLSAEFLPPGMRKPYLYNKPLNYLESLWFTKTRDPKIRAIIFKNRLVELDFQNPRTLLAGFKASSQVELRKMPLPPANARLIFVSGAKDNVAPLHPIKQLAKANNAPVIILDRVGHFLVNEDAARSASVFVHEPHRPRGYAIIKLT